MSPFVIVVFEQDVDKLEGARLKRVVLVGDHNQLPPVVQHMALQQYSKLEQSMFTRLIRLGVPHVLLDMQGRTRPVISNLYNWRYSRLENLPAVERDPEYQAANAGFKYPFQLINVEDFQDRGEFAPTPFVMKSADMAARDAARPVGPFQLLALGVNGIVGVGIFFAPAAVAANAPGFAGVWVFLLTGLAVVPVALLFAVLGGRFDGRRSIRPTRASCRFPDSGRA